VDPEADAEAAPLALGAATASDPPPPTAAASNPAMTATRKTTMPMTAQARCQ
jgi:hypothetical protein